MINWKPVKFDIAIQRRKGKREGPRQIGGHFPAISKGGKN
jgi:hypothetical protein